MAIRALLLDWDGTVVDSQAAILHAYHVASEEVVGRRFPVEPDDVQRIIQLRGADAFPIACGGKLELVPAFTKRFGEVYSAVAHEAPAFPGMAETLVGLAAEGVLVGIVTSKARKRLDPDIERVGLGGGVLTVTITGDDVASAKPHPEGIVKAMRQIGVAPSESAYVGDGPNDLLAARGAGIRVFGVEFGFHPEELRALGPDWMVDSYAALGAIVRGENAAG